MIKLKIDQKQYYSKKLAFKKLYKSLGLVWMENTKIGDVWANPDKMEKVGYVRKIPEEGNFKRFIIHDCIQMVQFLKGIGAVEISDEPFEEVVVKTPEIVVHEDYTGHKGFKELLNDVKDKLNIKWKLSEEEMTSFQKRWRELEIKYANYTKEDFYRELNKGKKLDADESEEVVTIEKKFDDDILPVKTSKKKSKVIRTKPVKIAVNPVKVEFKKKVFKITKK